MSVHISKCPAWECITTLIPMVRVTSVPSNNFLFDCMMRPAGEQSERAVAALSVPGDLDFLSVLKVNLQRTLNHSTHTASCAKRDMAAMWQCGLV